MKRPLWRHIPVAAVLSLAAQVTLPAQVKTSGPRSLEQAVFLDQTAGDLDGAIVIYKQLVAAGSDAKPAVQAQAAHNLVVALVKKGDLPGAITQFTEMQRRFKDNAGLVTDAGDRIKAEQRKPFGELVDKRYHDFRSGAQFDVPEGFRLASAVQVGDGATSMSMQGTTSGLPFLQVWVLKEDHTSEEIDQWIKIEIGAKAEQRGGAPEVKVRYDEVKEPTIHGHHGLVYILDYRNETELLTYVVSAKTRILFRGYAAPAQLPALRAKMDELVSSAQIP